MTNDTWRPLGVDTESEIAQYDALYDGVPAWMQTPLWRWIQDSLTVRTRDSYYGTFSRLDEDLTEQMCQTLQIPLPNIRPKHATPTGCEHLMDTAFKALRTHAQPLQIVDYLLAHKGFPDTSGLEGILERSKSVWRVGARAGRPGLERRVPLGVQVAADAVMSGTGDAGVRLAKAWGVLYGLHPNPSQAYSLAIKAVEDVAVPIVSPTNTRATLGTVLKQMVDQKNWELPMDRDPSEAPSKDVILSMGRLLWHGQHDRHGGQPSAPGNVSVEEATVAVSLAVTLVQWFHAGLVDRAAPKP